MNTDELNINIEKIELELPNMLSEKRYNHCKRVADFASRISYKTSIDSNKMYVAGLLHDVAKELNNNEILNLCDHANIYVPSTGKNNPHSLHGIAGAVIAYEKFGITDKDIILAIAYHSGRAAMTDPEKIVFLADFLDNSAKYNIDWTPIWKQKDLDSAMLVMCLLMTNYCLEHNVQMDERTQDSFDFILNEICEGKNRDEESIKKIRSDVDRIIDGAMNSYLEHRIKLSSIKNARDLGGINTMLNVPIKKGKIIRSGALSSLSKEDANKLKEMGIDTVIDLRTKEEVEKAPDINIEEFKYYNFPIATIETDENQERFLDYMKGSVNDEESSYYAAEYLRYVDMQSMYINIWNDDNSAEQIAKVYKLLIDPNTNGVLIHCTSGKDRTGVVSMQILYGLGCDDDEVINDYYASSLPYYMISESLALDLEKNGYSVELSNKARELLGIGSNMVESINKWWSETFVDGVDYLKNKLNVTFNDVLMLQEKYLDNPNSKRDINDKILSLIKTNATVLSINDDGTYTVMIDDNYKLNVTLSKELINNTKINVGSTVKVQLSINLLSGEIISVM